METIAKKKIILFTPNNFLPQLKYHNNIYQIHKSGWDVSIFRKMNFKIYGLGGIKYLKGSGAMIKYRPVELWNLIWRSCFFS